MKKLVEMTPEEQLRVVNIIAAHTSPDREHNGSFWEGEVDGVACKGYKSPDGKVLLFTYGDEGPFQSLHPNAVFGFALGDSVPNWAKKR